MTLNEIFPDAGEFMEWLAYNCYCCAKLGDEAVQHNPNCELEPIISHAASDKEIDARLVQWITQNGKLCRCKNFVSPISRSPPLSMDSVE